MDGNGLQYPAMDVPATDWSEQYSDKSFGSHTM